MNLGSESPGSGTLGSQPMRSQNLVPVRLLHGSLLESLYCFCLFDPQKSCRLIFIPFKE